MLRVGVFVDAPRDEMSRIADEVGLDVLQLHGDEPLEALAGLPRPALKAVRVGKGFAHEEALRYASRVAGSGGRHAPVGRDAASGRNGRALRLAAGDGPGRSRSVPDAGGRPVAGERGPGGARRASARGRRLERRRAHAGAQGPGSRQGLHRGARGRSRRRWERDEHVDAEGAPRGSLARRRRALRPLRRPLRARDADGAARRARGGVGRGAARPGLRGGARAGCCATTSAARRRSASRRGSPSGWAARSG